MQTSNKLWTELCKDIPYSPAYAISHLIDPSIFHFFNENDLDTNQLTIYMIYDSTIDNEKLLIFDNGVGYSKNELEQLIQFESITTKGWKQWLRALQWISNGAKIYSKKIEDSETYQIVFNNDQNQLTIDPLKSYGAKEFISRTKFGSGSLFQIKINKKWNIKEFSEIINQVNKIFQKYVNLKKIEFKAVYRKDNIFYDCADIKNPIEIDTYRKATSLKPIQRPKLFVDKDNENHISIDEKINLFNYTIGIKGFVGILETPDPNNSGIYCFHANKLVKGALTNTSLKPKEIFGALTDIEYSCIYGELEFSNIPVSITGDNFVINEDEYKEIVNLLTNIIGKQGETSKNKTITSKVNTEYEETMNILTSKTIEYSNYNDDENIEDSIRSTKAIIDLKVETVRKNKKETNVYSIKDEYGKEYKIQLVASNNRETSGCWIKKKYGNDGLIIVYFNQEHPFLKPIVLSSKKAYNTFTEFVIYYVMAEERAIIEGAGVDELKFLIDNYLRKGN
ncbi:hypothetical protein [Mycoplasmoides pirum]|uniref:hypothetical protein n=1 Tax=Mycoplasmoides pirum TaxID=2122 RepID=UPI0004877B8B|nr:hypothetical protein [Mycoplasmoides pirum]